MLGRFIEMNRRLCAAITPFLPQAKLQIFDLYGKVVGRYMNCRPDQVVVDVGAGKTCPFAQYRRPEQRTKIVGVDMSAKEMQENQDLDEKHVADITGGLPLADESVDLIVSRSVLEHLNDVEGFVAASKRALKEGGFFIHLFPARYAPFAVIRRLLPDPIARRLLFTFHPRTESICGFPAFYNECTPSRFQRILQRHGFDIVEMETGYFQSPYFDFLVPLFLLSAAYEMAVRGLQLKDLCSYVLVVARKVG